MAGLLYRPDMDDVRRRLTAWWNGADIGRPVLQIRAPNPHPIEDIPALPQPPGWSSYYSTRDFDYRVNLALRVCPNSLYLGDAVPEVAPDLAPNCLALFLGCHGVETSDSVWCEPCIADPEHARFEFDPANFYWQFSTRLAREQLRLGAGKFLTSFPDLIEGLDTLAAMRGAEPLLTDLFDRPEWVRKCLGKITDIYFEYYDRLYDMFRDEAGGSMYWAWAPGRMAKLQCDFSAMISPEMFGEFMVPVLRKMTARFDYCMYHWDGPRAIPHHDHLLSLPDLDMIQWTPGDGVEPTCHPRWWPLFHKTIDAGKKVFLGLDGNSDAEILENARRMKREFGPRLNQFLLSLWVRDPKTAEQLITETSA